MPSADQHERWTARLARAPADQASGKRRGARTWLACLAVLAALGTLGSDGANENGSWSDGSTIVDYVLDGPDWTRWAGVASVAAFILAAFLLWVARRRLWIAAGLVLLPLALVGACGSKVERNTAGRVAAASA